MVGVKGKGWFLTLSGSAGVDNHRLRRSVSSNKVVRSQGVRTDLRSASTNRSISHEGGSESPPALREVVGFSLEFLVLPRGSAGRLPASGTSP